MKLQSEIKKLQQANKDLTAEKLARDQKKQERALRKLPANDSVNSTTGKMKLNTGGATSKALSDSGSDTDREQPKKPRVTTMKKKLNRVSG